MAKESSSVPAQPKPWLCQQGWHPGPDVNLNTSTCLSQPFTTPTYKALPKWAPRWTLTAHLWRFHLLGDCYYANHNEDPSLRSTKLFPSSNHYRVWHRLSRQVSLDISVWSTLKLGIQGPVTLTVGVVLGPVLNLWKSFQINYCVKRWKRDR